MTTQKYTDDDIKIGELYIRFDERGVTFGYWDVNDIITLNYRELLFIHKYLLHKITKILIKIK